MYRYVGLGESIPGMPMADMTDEEYDAACAAYASGWPEEERAGVIEALKRRTVAPRDPLTLADDEAPDPSQLWVHEPERKGPTAEGRPGRGQRADSSAAPAEDTAPVFDGNEAADGRG